MITSLLTILYLIVLFIGIVRLALIYLNKDCKELLDFVPFPQFGVSMKMDIIWLGSITLAFFVYITTVLTLET